MARRSVALGDRRTSGPNPVDVHVGGRVRLRRTLLGMSQEKLGEAIGLTFQQVQKYERGANRVGASRLFDLSRVLDVPVGFFFDEMPTDVAASSPAQRPGVGRPAPEQELDPLVKRETLELVRAYYKIEDASVRKRLFEMTKALASASGRDSGKSED
ncbi:helix-turn-helix transcriptional regulator [Pelagibius litoralis]|uniref:Helix-turn-helix transcriptional regulator n=1 Tax=Pelagibius litoralis TaxID=374515 RepID=A0A967F2T8_9PROT|nr:helix-turn-helix transcriptional regulator [Pelagibius litoralis]NIA72161.1 helix-turn-helix transcriptional regulator [Pelagibius litoralis]